MIKRLLIIPARVGSKRIKNKNFKKFNGKPIIFYSIESARLLKQRIKQELTEFDYRKLKLKNINSKETQLISGPYTSVNLLKNDYIKLNNFGFEELDIFLNE